MRRLFALPFLLLLGAAPPGRIASVNLCADQYLLALADDRQIAGLTSLSRDPRLSAGAARAAALPVSGGSAEDVLALRPDLLLASPGTRSATMAHLRGRFPRLDLPPADSYADIVAQVRQVAAAIGHRARGEALIARMNARLARIPKTGRGRVAAYYQRRGFLTGTGTLVDELMGRVGVVNLAARLGRPVLARVSLEELALARPNFLLVESDSEQVIDQGTAMLHPPVPWSITCSPARTSCWSKATASR